MNIGIENFHRWDRLANLPKARYGHACLLMEWAGAEGVLVSGGALTRDQYSSKLSIEMYYPIIQADFINL